MYTVTTGAVIHSTQNSNQNLSQHQKKNDMQCHSCRNMGTDDQVKQVAMSLLKFELDELQNEFNESRMVGKKERLYYDRKKNLERQMSNGIETRMQ
jgi:hypothetical protein